MLVRFLYWLIGPEIYWPGQRVSLLSNYPSDMANAAHRGTRYGTVQIHNDRSRHTNCVRVLWDGFEGIRHHSPHDISSRILAHVPA